MTPNHRPSYLAIAVLAAVLAAAGCGGPDTASLVASAKSYLEKADTKAAIIQLRTALQKAPNNAEVRFLLGKAFLDNGEASAAEVELRKALDLKYSADAVLPLIAQALLTQGEFRKLATEFANPAVTTARARAEIATSVAVASIAQGDIKEAQRALDAAQAADPGYVRANVVRAQLAIRGRDVQAAHAALDSALAASPNDPEASVLKAELVRVQGRLDEALGLLEKSAAANPASMTLRFAQVSMLVSAQKVDKAEPILATMKKDAPADFRTVYSDALVSLAKGESARARELVQPLIAARPDHLPSLFLSGLANYHLKSYAVAEEALTKVIAKMPDDPAPRRVLIASYLKSGRATQAAEAADTALRRTPDDPMLLRLAGEARIQSGNIAEAARLYERATAVDKTGATAQLRLAQIRLATGDATRGLADLERLSSQDPTNIQADFALYAVHLRQREYDKALAAVASIEKKQPGSALVAELRGNVDASRRDFKAARIHYAKAFEIEPARLSSARSLALIDLQENKPGDARARYEKMIAAEPKNELPLIALAEVQALSGAPPSEVKVTLDRAIAANVNATGPRIALVAHYRRIGDNKSALEAARAANAALPNDAQIVEMFGAMQLASGEIAQARDTFTRLTQLLPNAPGPWLRVSETNIASRDYVSALDAQRKALAIQSDYAPALVALATTYLISGNPDEAIAEARRLQRERPTVALGFAIEAELLAAMKKPNAAVGPMREALARQPTPMLAARQYGLLVAAGRTADANAFADRWTREHAKDATFLNLVGQLRQIGNDKAGAIAAYRAALEVDPDNVVVLNNLAWLLSEQGAPEARELAERAYRLAPLNANIIDTLGVVLVRQGDTARGLSLLRMATNLAPQDHKLRLNLARALVKTGDKAGAKREVELVLSRAPRDPMKTEAEQLLREL